MKSIFAATFKSAIASMTILAICSAQVNTPQRRKVVRIAPQPVDTTPVPGSTPGESRTNSADGQQYAWIPSGSYTMGCAPTEQCRAIERPAHTVVISKGFWLAKTEVTVEAYQKFTASAHQAMPPLPRLQGRLLPQTPHNPVVDVSWQNAHDYCEWVGGRLPTEAEWEYAARAGSTGATYGDLDSVAWYAGNSGTKAISNKGDPNGNNLDEDIPTLVANGNTFHEVGLKKPNDWGLYDMLGNVVEWVADWYGGNYSAGQATDPTGPPNGTAHLVRGGGFGHFPVNVRANEREFGGQGASYSPESGFRCAWSGAQPRAGGNYVSSTNPLQAISDFAGGYTRTQESPLPASPSVQTLRSRLTPQTTPQEVAQMFWETMMIKCGTDYYLHFNVTDGYNRGWKLRQYKDGSTVLAPETLSRVDQLNGLQYAGQVALRASATRLLDLRARNWSAWTETTGPHYRIVKRNNQWHFIQGDSDEFDPDAVGETKISCSAIPQ